MMSPRRLSAVAGLVLGGVTLTATPAGAESLSSREAPLIFAVVVGNNDGLNLLPQLHYADDDALRFYRLAVQLASEQNVALLTELDVDTWRRIQVAGERPPPYLPPTKKKLIEVMELFKAQVARARRENPGRPVHLFFFFSGHGERGYFLLKQEGTQLADAAFTGEDLLRVLADSRATMNGLFIDACKSQSLFLKGRTAEDDELGPDFSGLIGKLDRTARALPIGVLTSTVSDKPAGEGRDIQGGYFSHVLTSGLSGAADANSDGVVRYGELVAFVSFHTQRIAGQRPWFRPPQGRMDEPLILLNGRRNLLQIPPGVGGHFAVFDEKGNHLLLELHKTEAQWSRIVLAPGKYRVVWVRSQGRGHLAHASLTGRPEVLMLKSFATEVELGRDRVPKGEGQGAPAEPEKADDAALRAYDPEASGFDQPFTPRIVATMNDAYGAGISAAPPPPVVVKAPEAPQHQLSLGYGYFGPPIEELTSAQGVTLAYSYRLPFSISVGGRLTAAFSDHTALEPGRSFRMQRLMAQAEGMYSHGLWKKRLELGAGAYLGWQLTMVTEDTSVGDQPVSALSGDPSGFRLGLRGAVRGRLWRELWLSLEAAWGLELVHDDAGAQSFARPQVFGEVAYRF